jgi:hypothetical protein
MAAFVRQLPSYLQTIGENVGPYQQSLVNARSTTDPQNLALDESLYRYFGPRFNELGAQLQGQNALNQAQNELSVVQGPGAELARAGLALNKEIDPEYYGLREQSASKFTDLLNGQDPNRLTGAEMANVERGLNRTNRVNGVANVPASGSAIANAMTFGGALDTKRNTLLNTLNAIPQNLAAMKSGTDSFQVATGRPSYGVNPGMNQYSTGKQGFGQDVSSMAGGLLGEVGQNVRQNNELTANARDSLDRVTQTMSSLPT